MAEAPHPSLDPSGDNPWRTLETGIAFESSQFRVVRHTVTQPDGAPGTYTYLELPGSVAAVVPVTEDRCVYLVRQWRYPWRRNSWEVPAGHCDPGETPAQGAARELAEEVGLAARDWTSLGMVFASATIDSEFHLYLARDLSPAPAGSAQRDGAEHDMQVACVPLAEAVRAVMDGTLVHAVTCLALLRTARLLDL